MGRLLRLQRHVAATNCEPIWDNAAGALADAHRPLPTFHRPNIG